MFRPPFAARVVTGLIVTAIEETKKLPTTAVTLPMTAVSSTVQAAMRMQQNIAELAIKGDEVFDTLFHRAEEKPEWATFDDDDAFMDPSPTRTDRSPAADGDGDHGEGDSSEPADNPTSDADGGATVTPISAAPGAAAATPADMPEHQAETVEPTPPVKKAPAKKAPATKAAAKAPAKKAPAKAPAKKAPAKAPAASASDDETGATGKGRFALYSSAPETVLQSDVESSPAAPAADAPEIVEFLDYDALTLAQLRAKIRSVDLDDLRALADYERGHRGRAPFQTMLDNRITAASAK
ncbi:hypothetical protein ASG12_15640 [Williamsia sp. Leaf354]|uniref:lipid droplet-associated protein n=1 Tax=Williamsia sp. Leaf354 TaxID=1736349 RepID=UPI0006F524D4|nr:lipid droplet-associated protein [Williamsia sp. Leaf354]KQR97370.1 hypothetical protein ASG12_15640 [Williamsia sp. Leaf354]